MQCAIWASFYVHNVIKGRWPEAEPVIMKNAKMAYWYAKHIIKGRWPEAEPFIKSDVQYWRKYRGFIPKEE